MERLPNVDLVGLILIGPAAGWLTAQTIGAGGRGLVGDLVVGVLGSVIGATVGAITLFAGLRVLKRL